MAFFVNVPNVLGVPAVLRAVTSGSVLSLLTADAVSLFSGFLNQQWGIYLGGAPVVVADNVVSFDYRQQWSVSDFPVERGAFQTYDKVQIPYDARFRFTAGGNEANRQSLLSSIAAIAGDYNLYDIVTPEAVYIGANITHYDYSRTAQNGVGLISVDVWTLEVREVAGSPMSSTQAPEASAQVNTGTVQASPASTTQAAQVATLAGSDFHLNN